ncbi:MAG: hypothetical protein ACJ8R9_30430 [Steroidobacteraceae bacterium]
MSANQMRFGQIALVIAERAVGLTSSHENRNHTPHEAAAAARSAEDRGDFESMVGFMLSIHTR